MAYSNEDHGRSRRPGAEDRGWSHRSGVAGRSRDRVAPCAVCTVHMETRSASFLVEPQNQGRRFVSGLASKPLRRFFAVLASKPVVTVSGSLTSKPAATVFAGLASKLVATVFSSLALKLVAIFSPGLASKPVDSFLVEPQNQGGGGFPGLGLKTGSFSLVIWASKSPRRYLGLGLKTMWASVCQLCHKTDGGRSARDTRQNLATCFVWKQVWPEDGRRRDDGWCT
jgi:hypothetical protein